MNEETIKSNIRTILLMEYFGIRIEKQTEHGDFTHMYFSVPESSTVNYSYDEKLNTLIKTSAGLIEIAKKTLIEMFKKIIVEDLDDAAGLNIYVQDYVKFFAKVRTGEVWNKEMAEERVKELGGTVTDNNEYQEV